LTSLRKSISVVMWYICAKGDVCSISDFVTIHFITQAYIHPSIHPSVQGRPWSSAGPGAALITQILSSLTPSVPLSLPVGLGQSTQLSLPWVPFPSRRGSGGVTREFFEKLCAILCILGTNIPFHICHFFSNQSRNLH
jgi:hypothetical protein